MDEIRILDACCGSKMFWFDKAEPHTTYMLKLTTVIIQERLSNAIFIMEKCLYLRT